MQRSYYHRCSGVCCRGMRPCAWTLVFLLVVNVLYRVLLLLEGQGTLARHGFNITIPKISLRLGRKPPTVSIPMEFLISEPKYCSSRPELLAVALIPSRVEDLALRQETRQTWGSAQNLGVPLGQVFLLGRPANKVQRKLVKEESRRYHDVVQGDYEDDLQASKTLNGVLWLAMNCAMVPFTIHASDKVMLDVFLLQSFLWEVLDVPEKQGMLFGKLVPYQPPKEEPSTGWSFKDLGHLVPEVTEPPIGVYPPYFEEGAWFGRTQAVAKLLSASGGVPLVSPVSVYLTGLLATAAGLHKSPDVFNAWWRTDREVRPEEIGLVLGWLNKDLDPPRTTLWKLLMKHHGTSFSKTENQVVRREIKLLPKIEQTVRPKTTKQVSTTDGNNKKTVTYKSEKKKKKISTNKSTFRNGGTYNTTRKFDPRMQQTYLFRKKQLDQMMRTTGIKVKLASNKTSKTKYSKKIGKPKS